MPTDITHYCKACETNDKGAERHTCRPQVSDSRLDSKPNPASATWCQCGLPECPHPAPQFPSAAWHEKHLAQPEQPNDIHVSGSDAPEEERHKTTDPIGDLSYHYLKIAPQHFDDVVDGIKRAEVRKHDRDYWVGDILRLKEWMPAPTGFTGREVDVRITHILPGDQHGIAPGYSVLSIKRWGPAR